MSYQVILDVYAVLFGLVIGSYLNVVVFRLPRGISTILPRSRCPRCRTAIQPWDNIPVISYLLLRGQCRVCGLVIHWRYPLVELITAGCFYLSVRRFDTWLDIATAIGFSAVMIVLAMIDLEHFLLPDVLTKPGIVLGLALSPWLSWTSLQQGLVGAFFGGGVLALVSWGWYWWKGVHGMGFGDVKMLAMIGAFLGLQGAVVTLLLASLSGSLVGGALLLTGRVGTKSKLPFGFFLALGALATLFWGREIVGVYLNVTGMRFLAPNF